VSSIYRGVCSIQSEMSEIPLKRKRDDDDDDCRKRAAISESDSSTSRTDEAAIAAQKKRAIQYWNESNYSEPLKHQVHDDVMTNLHEGKVLPIFHTLCRPPNERLFPPEQRVSVEHTSRMRSNFQRRKLPWENVLSVARREMEWRVKFP
jgi:hypothetical protein